MSKWHSTKNSIFTAMQHFIPEQCRHLNGLRMMLMDTICPFFYSWTQCYKKLAELLCKLACILLCKESELKIILLCSLRYVSNLRIKWFLFYAHFQHKFFIAMECRKIYSSEWKSQLYSTICLIAVGPGSKMEILMKYFIFLIYNFFSAQLIWCYDFSSTSHFVNQQKDDLNSLE